jgi:exoribonuclease II
LQALKYDWHGEHALDMKEEDSYEKMLSKNGVVLDREVLKRIADIDKY